MHRDMLHECEERLLPATAAADAICDDSLVLETLQVQGPLNLDPGTLTRAYRACCVGAEV